MDSTSDSLIAIFFLSLRFVPVFSFSPPFTLLRIPLLVRVLLGISLSLWIVISFPAQTRDLVKSNSFYQLAISEISLGVTLALALQWAFAAIFMIGRSLDIQAGFAMALLADPATRSQIPLLGTVFAYGAAIVFFSTGGVGDLLAIFVESVVRVPLGSGGIITNPARLISFITVAFVFAVGLVGLVMLVLFMIDLTVAFISRTLPQVNVLLIGFQVKTIAILATTPIALALSLGAYLRLVRGALQTTFELLPI